MPTTLQDLQVLRGRAAEQQDQIKSQLSEIRLAEQDAIQQQSQLEGIKRGITNPLKRARPGTLEATPRYTRQRMNFEQTYLRTEYPKFLGQITNYFSDINKAKGELADAQTNVNKYISEIDVAIKDLLDYEALKGVAAKGGSAVTAASKSVRKAYAKLKSESSAQIDEYLFKLQKQFPELRFKWEENQVMINDPKVNNNFESISFYTIQANKERYEIKKTLEDYYGVKISNRKIPEYIAKYNAEIASQQPRQFRNPLEVFRGRAPSPGAFINSLVPIRRTRITDIPARTLGPQFVPNVVPPNYSPYPRPTQKQIEEYERGREQIKEEDPGFFLSPSELPARQDLQKRGIELESQGKIDLENARKEALAQYALQYARSIAESKRVTFGDRVRNLLSRYQLFRYGPFREIYGADILPSPKPFPKEEYIFQFGNQLPEKYVFTNPDKAPKRFYYNPVTSAFQETKPEYRVVGRFVTGQNQPVNFGMGGFLFNNLVNPRSSSITTSPATFLPPVRSQSSYLVPQSDRRFKATITTQPSLPFKPYFPLNEADIAAEKAREMVYKKAKDRWDDIQRENFFKENRKQEFINTFGYEPRSIFSRKPQLTYQGILNEEWNKFFGRKPEDYGDIKKEFLIATVKKTPPTTLPAARSQTSFLVPSNTGIRTRTITGLSTRSGEEQFKIDQNKKSYDIWFDVFFNRFQPFPPGLRPFNPLPPPLIPAPPAPLPPEPPKKLPLPVPREGLRPIDPDAPPVLSPRMGFLGSIFSKVRSQASFLVPSNTGITRRSTFQDTPGNYGSIIGGSAFGARPTMGRGTSGINKNVKGVIIDVPAKELPGIMVTDYTDDTSPRITRFLTQEGNYLAGTAKKSTIVSKGKFNPYERTSSGLRSMDPLSPPQISFSPPNRFTNFGFVPRTSIPQTGYDTYIDPFLNNPFSTPRADVIARQALIKTKDFLFGTDPFTKTNAQNFARREALKKGFVEGSGQYQAFVEKTVDDYVRWVPFLETAFQSTIVGVPNLPKISRIPTRAVRPKPIFEIEQRQVIFEGIESIPKPVSSYIINTEVRAPSAVFRAGDEGGFLGKAPGDFLIEPPVIKVTRTIRPVIGKAPVFTFTSRGGRTGQIDVLFGKNIPQNLEQLKRLPLNEQYLWRQLASQEVRRVVGLTILKPSQYTNSREASNLFKSNKISKTTDEMESLFRKQIKSLYASDGLVKLENVPKVLERIKAYSAGDIIKYRLANVRRTQDSYLFTTAPPGKRITRFKTASITETKPIIETPEFDILTGRVYYKETTKPFSRASGKIPSMKGTIKTYIEPSVIRQRGVSVRYEEPTEVLLQKPANIQKTPFSRTFPQTKSTRNYFNDLLKEARGRPQQAPPQTQTVTDYLIPAMVPPKVARVSKIRTKPPRFASPSATASRSAFYGLGLYERTEGGLLPGEINVGLQRINQGLVPNQLQQPSQLTQQRQRQQQRQVQRQIDRQIERQIQLPGLFTRQQQRQIQRPIQRQIQRQVPRQTQVPRFPGLVPGRPPRPPLYPPRIPKVSRKGKSRGGKESPSARRKRLFARQPTGFGLITGRRDYSVPTAYLVGTEQLR